MTAGLLSLKWNNHQSTFISMLTDIRCKESLSDVTLLCGDKFYPLHKFVLSTCSEYFENIFQKTTCKHPVVVLKDISSEDFEALLHYMYIGEVNVVQEKLSSLIKAAESLQIKGLAGPDDVEKDVASENPSPCRAKRVLNVAKEDISYSKKKRKLSTTSSEDGGHHSDITQTRSDGKRSKSLRLNAMKTEDSNTILNPKTKDLHEDVYSSCMESEGNFIEVNQSNGQYADVKVELEEEDGTSCSDLQDSKDLLQGQYLDNNQDNGSQTGESLDPSHLEVLSGWNECIGNDTFESSLSSYQEHSVLSDPCASATDHFPHAEAYLEETPNNLAFSTRLLNSAFPLTIPHQPVPRSSRGRKQSSSSHSHSRSLSAFAHSSSSLQRNTSVRSSSFSGARMLHCSVCSYTTNRPAKLTIHMRTHTGEKPFACHLCSYRSARKESVRTHMRLHDRDANANLM